MKLSVAIYLKPWHRFVMKASTLRAIRARLGLSQAEFGRKIGRGTVTISEMEQRKRPINVAVAMAVLAVDAGLEDAEPGDEIERILDGAS